MRWAAPLALLLAVLGPAGCVSEGVELLAGLGLPTARARAQVLDRVQHGAYVITSLEFEEGTLRFVFPDTPECFRVLQVPGGVEYWREGRVGDFVRGASHCRAIGIGSLEAWRDRASRPLAATLPADSGAHFNPFFVDGGVILVRGNLPKAARIGWRPTGDLVAILPRNPACEQVAAAGEATMRFHPSGFPAFTLSSEDTHCAILALSDPA